MKKKREEKREKKGLARHKACFSSHLSQRACIKEYVHTGVCWCPERSVGEEPKSEANYWIEKGMLFTQVYAVNVEAQNTQQQLTD